MSFAPTIARQAFTLLTSGFLSSVSCTPKTGSVVSHGSDTELEMSVRSGGGFNQAIDVSCIGDAATRVEVGWSCHRLKILRGLEMDDLI